MGLFRPHSFPGWLVLAACLAFQAPAANADEAGALDFVDGLATQATAILQDRELTVAEFEGEFRLFIERAFDVLVIGRFALGPYWRVASPEQLAEYQIVFLDYIVNTYASLFLQYTGESLEVGDARALNERETLVSSDIIRPQAQDISITWHVRETADGYKIIDILFQGLRLGLLLRDQFSAAIRAGGGDIDVLIEDLRARAALGI